MCAVMRGASTYRLTRLPVKITISSHAWLHALVELRQLYHLVPFDYSAFFARPLLPAQAQQQCKDGPGKAPLSATGIQLLSLLLVMKRLFIAARISTIRSEGPFRTCFRPRRSYLRSCSFPSASSLIHMDPKKRKIRIKL